MHIRLGRAGKAAALGAALTVIGGGVCSAQSRAHNENSLLGITLLKSSYRDVLKRFGRPDEIQAGGPYMPSLGGPSAGQPGGMAGGGGGGQRGTSKSGFPGGGGTGATMPGGGGYPGAMGRGGYPGAGGAPGGMGGGSPYGGGGLPGFGYPGSGGGSPYGGAPGGMGAGPGMGLPGGDDSGAAGGAASANAEEAQDEATWWYHDRANGLHKSFLFNKDGRVIQVQEYGFDKKHKGGKTRAGVGLGSGLNQVLRTYGWSNDGANAGRNVILRYGGDEKVAFQFVNNVVVGITVAVVKEATPTEESQ